jgi:hypothetical protein
LDDQPVGLASPGTELADGIHPANDLALGAVGVVFLVIRPCANVL